MIDVHVHLSSRHSGNGYFVPLEQAVAELAAQRTGDPSLTHFCCFPHGTVATYNTKDLNLSLIGLPEFIVPFFRFKLRKSVGKDILSTRNANPKALLKYSFAKSRMKSEGDDLEETVSLAKSYGVKGLKFHDLQDGTLDETAFRRLLQLDVVIVYHGFPRKIRSLLVNSPAGVCNSARCLFVFAHFGYSLHAPTHELEDILWLAQQAPPWILFDTSFVTILPLVRPVLGATSSRLLFGSDFPAMEPRAQFMNLLANARLCGIPEASVRDNLERNSRDVASVLGLRA